MSGPANEPPTKRSRSERESEGSTALGMTGGSDASDDKEVVDHDDHDGQAGARDNWLDLDGCRTIEDVRRVVHARFRTSQQLLDYIQAYKVSLVLFIPRKPCKSTQTLQVNAANFVIFLLLPAPRFLFLSLRRSQDIRLLKIIPLLMQRPRSRLTHVCSLDIVLNLVSSCKNILVLTGAGVSVSAGIPDFRSSDGIYRRLREEFGMPTPECMFDKEYFDRNPQPFFSFAHELWPGNILLTYIHTYIHTCIHNAYIMHYVCNTYMHIYILYVHVNIYILYIIYIY